MSFSDFRENWKSRYGIWKTKNKTGYIQKQIKWFSLTFLHKLPFWCRFECINCELHENLLKPLSGKSVLVLGSGYVEKYVSNKFLPNSIRIYSHLDAFSYTLIVCSQKLKYRDMATLSRTKKTPCRQFLFSHTYTGCF